MTDQIFALSVVLDPTVHTIQKNVVGKVEIVLLMAYQTVLALILESTVMEHAIHA